MLAALMSLVTWLFGSGGADKLLALFKKPAAQQMKEDATEVKNANDRAQRTRGDMRDVDRTSG